VIIYRLTGKSILNWQEITEENIEEVVGTNNPEEITPAGKK
jgi:hypothetical protein